MHTHSPDSIVTLPRLSAGDAVALGTALVTHARSQPALPPIVRPAYAGLSQSLEQLHRAMIQRTFEVEADSNALQAASRNLTAAWGAVHGWLKGWSRMPWVSVSDASEPGPDALPVVAARIYGPLFPDGLRFTQLPARNLWVASQGRLDYVESHDVDEVFSQLGGLPLLRALERAHAEYGRAIGLTEVSRGPEQVSVRDRLDAFLTALRTYVIRVAASVDPGEADSDELASALLAPLAGWRAGKSATNEVSEAADGVLEENASSDAANVAWPGAGSDVAAGEAGGPAVAALALQGGEAASPTRVTGTLSE